MPERRTCSLRERDVFTLLREREKLEVGSASSLDIMFDNTCLLPEDRWTGRRMYVLCDHYGVDRVKKWGWRTL